MRERPMDEYEATLRSVLVMLRNATIAGEANRTTIRIKLDEARSYYERQGRTSASAAIRSVLSESGLLDGARSAA